MGREVVAGDEIGVGKEGAVVDETDETRKARVARTPKGPTAKDIDEHLPLHANYRSWCKWCVFGKGVSNHHKAGDATEEKLGVTISMDHCFCNPSGKGSGCAADVDRVRRRQTRSVGI